MNIVPALLSPHYEHITDDIRRLVTVAGRIKAIQIDICDGSFVTSKTWPFSDQTPNEDAHFQALIHETEGLPLWEDFDFEADLMISKPLAQAEMWVNAGFSKLIFHADALLAEKEGNAEAIIAAFDTLRSLAHITVAILPGHYLDEARPEGAAVLKLLAAADSIQCMGIARIGYQGEVLDPKVYTQIEAVKQHFPDKKIAVDGGVRLENAADLVRVGADTLVVGSLLSDSDDPRGIIEMLSEAAS